jgi:phosphatidylinositol alpha-1,6-mannosyltransferase
VLVWHLGMVKLLPFLQPRPSRVVLFLHGVEAWSNAGLITTALVKNRVSSILTNSDFTWRKFAGANPALAGQTHSVVPLGTGTPLGGPTPRPDTPPIALMLSRLHPGDDYKGHREVIEAWPEVRRAVAGARLIIAGDGGLRPNLAKHVAAVGAGDAVTFHGRVTESEKETLLRQSRCFILPSRGEGFGLVYLEAMRLGRPCLVSHGDAGREVVAPPEAGLAADPGDKGQLIDAICELLQSGSRWDRWSEAARRRYEGAYTAAAFQARLQTAFSD